MMNTRSKKRFSSLLLVLALVISCLSAYAPNYSAAADVDPDATVVIACSDFQHPNGNTAGQALVQKMLDPIIDAGYDWPKGFLCCGDYDYEYTETQQGVTALRNTIEDNFGTDLDIVMVQGNHDQVPIGTAGMNPSGNNDTDNYGVFVINEDDYMWYNNDQNRVIQTAENLKKYLYGKRLARYTKPIFVVSHLPLHYSMRTRNDGDGQYAKYIFNELNDAGANGLNIIFLFGHNHSHGWDDYLGGACIYQEKGEELLISDGTRNSYTRETLEFTYMNAGYVGYYYGGEDQRNAGADDTLTMTTFEIRNDKIIVSRFDENGLHNLKSTGVSNESEGHNEKANGGYDPLTNIVESPAEIELSKKVTPVDESDFDYGECDHPRSIFVDITDPTCTEKGFDGDERCTNCGEILSDGMDIPALGHDWDAGVITTPATKDAAGVKTYTCKRCGEKKTETIPRLAADPADSGTQNPQTANPAGAGTDNTAYVSSVAISSAKNTAKKTVVVKWKKNAQATGYEIWYSAKKNFKGKKIIKVKKATTTSTKIKKLKKGTYFIKIRAYLTANGKTVYSGWSGSKKVKVKR